MAENAKLRTTRLEDALALASDTRVLILEAPYYQVVTDHLIAGANAVLEKYKSFGDRFQVPGALEYRRRCRPRSRRDSWVAMRHNDMPV